VGRAYWDMLGSQYTLSDSQEGSTVRDHYCGFSLLPFVERIIS